MQSDSVFERSLAAGILSEAETAALENTFPVLQFSVAADPTVGAQPSYYNEDGSFFEDFADGINFEHWHLMRGRWGHGNNGVVPGNAACTKDGILVLNGYGDRYDGDANDGNGKRSGAVISTNRGYGPGCFEVRMKALPHMGSCTAMWTYYNDGTRNHEIDIELPGNTENFTHPLFTNWLTVEDYTQTKNTSFPHNDGEWHVYRFDWHTEPKRIDYYVDGVLQTSFDHHVPTAAGLFNVGVWFPWKWCGEPEFDSACMLVDWIRYTPYDEPFEPYTRPPWHRRRPPEGPPPPPPQTVYTTLPLNNFVANGSFALPASGWLCSGDASVVSLPQMPSLLRLGADAGVRQEIHAINENADYLLTLAAGGEGIAAAHMAFLTQNGQEIDTLSLDCSGSPAVHSLRFTTPPKTRHIRLTLFAENGTAYFGSVYLTQPCRGDFVLETE